MKVLFITQKVDKNDDVLGVYHRWIEKLSEKVEKINVICLFRGRTELPENVKVYSLGKENYDFKFSNYNSRSIFNSSIFKKVKYILRFYYYLYKLHNDYDKAFVHMNPEYMLLAGLWWRLTGKKPILWYNHPMGGWRSRVAIFLAKEVLHTSPYAFAARYKKARKMPVGVDTDLFKPIIDQRPTASSRQLNILYVGRISPIKNIDVLLQAVAILASSQNINNGGILDIKLKIVGAPTPGKSEDDKYLAYLKRLTADLNLLNIVEFKPPVPNRMMPWLYNQHDVCINLTPSGSFDKTIIEAMACGIPVIASNKSVSDILSSDLIFQEKNPDDLAQKIKQFSKLTDDQKAVISEKLRRSVIEKHSLNKLVGFLTS